MHYPWLLAEDFIQVLTTTDKHNTCSRIEGAKDFNDALFYSGHIELRSTGFWFTWKNNREKSVLVMEKLGKSFCNEAWLSLDPEFYVLCLPIITSNHGPILIEFEWICGSQVSTVLM